MLSVEEALFRVLEGVFPLGAEPCGLWRAGGRLLLTNLNASGANPPCDVSAMDGYALRASDGATPPYRLRLIGEAPAGSAFEGVVGPGECVRIFTGGPIPQGADAVIVQEDAAPLDGGYIEMRERAFTGKHIRRKGSDFSSGDRLLKPGRRLDAPTIALSAAAGHATLEVARPPRVGILATGDELVAPGAAPGPHQIVASNSVALAALIAAAGSEAVDLGIAPDDPHAIVKSVLSPSDLDCLVTTGGASVGDRDYLKSALGAAGLRVDFWKIAMKPGKPLIFGQFQGKPFFGLPGNPVSALVCGLLFLRPALLKMQGRDPTLPTMTIRLAEGLPQNGARQDYLRATLSEGDDNILMAHIFPVQDSAMLKTLAQSDALVIRPPLAPAAQAGALVPAIPLAGLW